ncbi:hypothetical protein lerEdw1_002958 [Lerista edwardsae]|nr:hypothetical protein lerEdw1_002958 [Lerista edwardsae]
MTCSGAWTSGRLGTASTLRRGRRAAAPDISIGSLATRTSRDFCFPPCKLCLPARPGCLTLAAARQLWGWGCTATPPRQLDISCVDFSPLAIDALRQLLQDSPPARHALSRLHCHVADATNLAETFTPGSFHLILDKGTCDSLLRCPQGPGRARKLVAGCLRVLRPEGTLLQFSDEDPDVRMPFLEQAGGASITVKEMGRLNGICYYVYMVGQQAPGVAGG